jgi:hypothetical protein
MVADGHQVSSYAVGHERQEE